MTEKKKGRKEKNVYSLYKGEDILAIGTMSEIAKEHGVARETVKHWASKAYRKRLASRPRRGEHKIVDKIGTVDEFE